jgi:CheY-like chemotaxis protein/DNA-directed RNA polymerase specialized sigma24 family protein
MGQAQEIAKHLPFLRRYARALTGEQTSGDAHVRAVLEAILADQSVMPAELPPRIGLFRVFHVLWTSTQARPGHPAAASEAERTAQARLSALVSEERQALLLSSLEGFSRAEVASILGCSLADVEALVAHALEDIARDISTGVLVIEDVPVIALDLCNIVEDLGHTVTHVAASRKEAVAAARERRPGLILADIQLADGSSGIDAVKDIQADGPVPVIFITAYPEQLLTGDRPEPAFVITKPFLPESVKAAISQALFFRAPAPQRAQA